VHLVIPDWCDSSKSCNSSTFLAARWLLQIILRQNLHR